MRVVFVVGYFSDFVFYFVWLHIGWSDCWAAIFRSIFSSVLAEAGYSYLPGSVAAFDLLVGGGPLRSSLD